MNKPLLIFDYDGVLVDTVDLIDRELRSKLKQLGYTFLKSREDVVKLFDENIGVSFIERGVTPAHMCAIWEHIHEVSKTADIKLYPGMGEMLAALKPRCNMAIVSSNSTDTIREVLERLGVLASFETISGGESDVGKVERMKECMRKYDATPINTLYIGDTAGDIAEAREAGISAAAVTWGMHSSKRLSQESPYRLIEKPSNLMQVVDALSAS